MWDKRRGKFDVSRKLMEMCVNNEWLRECLFSNFVIVRAEFLYMEDKVEYTAFSPLFREVNDGEETPKYSVIVTEERDKEGNIAKYDVKVKEGEDSHVYDNQLW